MDIQFADSSDDNIDDNNLPEKDQCVICGGQDDGQHPERWVGCRCGRWLHRWCADVDFQDMTEEEVEAFLFTCGYC